MFGGGKRHLNFNVNEKATLYHKNGIFIISCIFFSKSQDFFAFKSILKFLMNESVLKNPTPLKTQNKRKKVKNNFEPNTDKMKKNIFR